MDAPSSNPAALAQGIRSSMGGYTPYAQRLAGIQNQPQVGPSQAPQPMAPQPMSVPQAPQSGPPMAIQPMPPTPTYATHAPQGLQDRPWQIETTLQHPGSRKALNADLAARNISGELATQLRNQRRFDRQNWYDQEQRNYKSAVLANRGGDWEPNRPAPTPYDPWKESKNR